MTHLTRDPWWNTPEARTTTLLCGASKTERSGSSRGARQPKTKERTRSQAISFPTAGDRLDTRAGHDLVDVVKAVLERVELAAGSTRAVRSIIVDREPRSAPR
ncbi:hypothetical protein [Cellulosimicrobium sp. RS]|uniref:hypothetical protein n=1 Tax=Cellulosimicrobium sp. RS TaxID=3381347 RepID=UPI0038FD00CC